MGKITELIPDAIRERSVPEPNTGCWLWLGVLSPRGYGKLKSRGHSMAAHRASYISFRGPIPGGLCVLHRCDNPPCVNPDHLWLGTNADNSADMVAKGRSARGERHGSATHPERVARGDRNGLRLHPEMRATGVRNGKYTHPEATPRGERHGHAKLKADDVRAIRAAALGGENRRSIAARFGIDKTNVSCIVRRVTWAWLGD